MPLSSTAIISLALSSALSSGSSLAPEMPFYPDPTWVAPVPLSSTFLRDQPRLSLAENGDLYGTDGCNGLSGRWQENAEGFIDLSDRTQTAMSCMLGTDQRVERAASALIEGDKLLTFDVEGNLLGTLVAVPQAR